MKEYKVGDEVWIRPLAWYHANADAKGNVNGTFVKDMATYCGQKAHITVIDTDGTMMLDLPSQHYFWAPFMFQPQLKYRQGDTVIIKSKDWYEANKEKDGYIHFTETSVGFTKHMSEFCGKVTTVREVTPQDTYRLDIDDGKYYWHDEMLQYTEEPVEYAIGATFEEKGKTFKVVLDEANRCTGCAFDTAFNYMCQKLKCGLSKRTDGQSVIFEEVDAGDEEPDYPIGTVFTVEDGKHFLVIEDNDCQKCSLHRTQYCGKYLCLGERRADKTSVIFKEYGNPKEEPEWAEAEEIKEELPIPKVKTGINVIIEERLRQLKAKGYDSKHDDKHDIGQLALAAALYIDPTLAKHIIESMWPEGKDFYHPEPIVSIDARIKQLAKAGALITAEIDRLYRVQERLGDIPQEVQKPLKGGFSD